MKPKIILSVSALALSIACATKPAHASSIVYACTNAAGMRTSWAGDMSECPTTTIARPVKLIDPCLDLPPGASCACERGVARPPDTQANEYMCCEDVAVCGEIDCYVVQAASDCQADYLLWECANGQTNLDGSTECYP